MNFTNNIATPKPSRCISVRWQSTSGGTPPSRFDVKSRTADFRAMHAATAVEAPPKRIARAAPTSPTRDRYGLWQKIGLCEVPHPGAAHDVPKQSSAHHAEKGDTRCAR